DYASRAPELAGSLLGASAPKTYLILGQDNAEPRATGGFVGVMGPIELSAGRVTHTDFRSSYDWDDDPRLTPLAPPQALQRYMNSGAWFLRDANWWPDFRQSAGQVETLWTHRQGGPVDGVIAVDLQALDDLLVAVDGVDVPELGGHVTAGTAEDEIEKRRATRQALASYADYQRTKTELLSALYRALLARLLAPAPEQLPGIAAVVAHDLQTKHLMLEFDDPQLAAVAAGQAWDGRLSAQDESSLAIFDTELSYGKLGPYISKEARYEVGPGGRANLSITYGNSFRPTPGAAWDPFISGLHWDWQKRQFLQEQGAWLGYIRVVVPGGTRLEAGSGWDDQVATTDDVPGSTTFAAPLLLEPGQSRTVSLQYQLPAALSPDSLTAIAQPGARPFSLNARLPAYTQSIVLDGRDVRLEPPR
ncbi:MAG TPA: DUF4012 domain-containing protein, partial [Chloroflexota bacterium]